MQIKVIFERNIVRVHTVLVNLASQRTPAEDNLISSYCPVSCKNDIKKQLKAIGKKTGNCHQTRLFSQIKVTSQLTSEQDWAILTVLEESAR